MNALGMFSRWAQRSAIAGALTVAGAFGVAHADDQPIFDGSATVAFVGYSGSVTRWNQIDFPNFEKWMKVYAPNAKVRTYDPQGNPANQLSMVRSAIVAGADAMAIAAFQDSPTAILDATKTANIPVVLYIFIPKEITPGSVTALVGTDPEEIGKAQGQYVLDHAAKGATVAIVNGDLGTSYANSQHNGIMSVLQPAFDSGQFKLLADKSTEGWLTAKAEANVSSILTGANNKVDVFIMGNDDMAQGAISALRHAGLDGKTMVLGQDGSIPGLQAIMEGLQTGTAYRNLYDESRALAEATAYTLAKKKPPADFYGRTLLISGDEVPFRPTPVSIIDKSNMSKVLDDGMATKADLCKGLPASVGAPCQ